MLRDDDAIEQIMATGEAIDKLKSYLQAHPDLALWWNATTPGGYWEIVYVTEFIGFEGDALASVTLEDLARRLPDTKR